MAKRYREAILHYNLSVQIIIVKISNRIDSGKNALIVVIGQTGSGKSLSVLQLMRGIYIYRNGVEPTNDYMVEHLFFKAKDFMKQMKIVSDSLIHKTKRLNKGEAWLWDEAGIDISHKSFASLQNKILGWLAQTFRNLQQIVFFTVPSINMIDATVRKLLHYFIEAEQIDRKNNLCIMKPLVMQYNARMDKIYYHDFQMPSKNEMLNVDRMGVPKISSELEKMYEVKKNQFTGKLNTEILSMLEQIDVKEYKKSIASSLTERQQLILKEINKGVYKQLDIAKTLGVNPDSISANLGYMRRKGYNIDDLLKKNRKIGHLR